MTDALVDRFSMGLASASSAMPHSLSSESSMTSFFIWRGCGAMFTFSEMLLLEPISVGPTCSIYSISFESSQSLLFGETDFFS